MSDVGVIQFSADSTRILKPGTIPTPKLPYVGRCLFCRAIFETAEARRVNVVADDGGRDVDVFATCPIVGCNEDVPLHKRSSLPGLLLRFDAFLTGPDCDVSMEPF